jgi:hypothetical protein
MLIRFVSGYEICYLYFLLVAGNVIPDCNTASMGSSYWRYEICVYSYKLKSGDCLCLIFLTAKSVQRCVQNCWGFPKERNTINWIVQM